MIEEAFFLFIAGYMAPIWFPVIWDHPWVSLLAVLFFGALILMGGD